MTRNERERADLVTVPSAARLRGLYAPRLRREIARGNLRAYEIGRWTRVRLADVDEWIERQRVGAGPFQPNFAASLHRVRDLIEEAVGEMSGFKGRIRPSERPLSKALDLIAAALDALQVAEGADDE